MKDYEKSRKNYEQRKKYGDYDANMEYNKDCAYTITTRQDRTPAQVIDRGDGRYRYLTERECWRLMGYSDEDFDRAKAVQERNGKYYKALYDQAGNSIAVPIFESIFRKIILQEVA